MGRVTWRHIQRGCCLCAGAPKIQMHQSRWKLHGKSNISVLVINGFYFLYKNKNVGFINVYTLLYVNLSYIYFFNSYNTDVTGGMLLLSLDWSTCPWYVLYNAECQASRYHVKYFESLLWLDLGLTLHLWGRWELKYLRSSYELIVEQTSLFKLGMVTSLGEGKLNSV